MLNGACWNGRELRFGDRDESLFLSLSDQDIVTHEMGHAVTTFSSDLLYKDQSGALAESFSDIFAIVHKQQLEGVRANDSTANWNFAQILKYDDKYYPIRSLSHPGKAFSNHPALENDEQVCHMRDYKSIDAPPSSENDWGFVHSHAGIPSHAFYLAAIDMQGLIEDKIGRIWWKAIQNAEKTETFSSFAAKTIQSTKNLYPGEQHENILIMGKGWNYS